MIYTVYWEAFKRLQHQGPYTPEYIKNHIGDRPGYDQYRAMSKLTPLVSHDLRKYFPELISQNKDSFIFIITNSQLPEFDKWVKDSDLGKHILSKVGPLVNENYPGSEPRLNIFVLAGEEHIMRKENAEN